MKQVKANQLNLIKQKDFILGVVMYGNQPDKSNDNLLSILKSYKALTGVEFDLSICLTCGNNSAMEKVYLYCKEHNWFKPKNTKNDGNKKTNP